MRTRKMTETGDYLAGPRAVFLINTPQAVAQAVGTRLQLHAGDWFLDSKEGLDLSKILGNGTQGTRDFEVKQRILGTEGVLSILSYESEVNDRAFTVRATIDTIYGATQVTGTF